jgi:hypothetical protein
MTNIAFEERCQSNPQGVIVDLVAQTTRQAKSISELTIEITRLQVLLTGAGIDATAPPKSKKIAGRKKKIDDFDALESEQS